MKRYRIFASIPTIFTKVPKLLPHRKGAMNMRSSGILIAIYLLTSCGENERTPEQQIVAEAHAAVIEKLKDPESARFKETSIDVMPTEGVVCGTVNARNGFGGYTGHQNYVYVRGQGATLSEDDPKKYIKALNACTEALKIGQQRVESETAKLVGSMDSATRATFESDIEGR